jgi:hypothetical protein
VWAEVAREIFLIAESLEYALEGLLGLPVGEGTSRWKLFILLKLNVLTQLPLENHETKEPNPPAAI